MADLTEEQMKSYRRYNLSLTTVLRSNGFVSSHILPGLCSGRFYQLSFIGFPLG